MKEFFTILLILGICPFALTQFKLSEELSDHQAKNAEYRLVFTNNDLQYVAAVPQLYPDQDSISVLFYDTMKLAGNLAMRLKLHLINSKTKHYSWEQVAIPLKLLNPKQPVETVATPQPSEKRQKYIQIGAFRSEQHAMDLKQQETTFKTKILKIDDYWKVLVPYEVGLYSIIRESHKDAFITFY
ncbi:MAG: hypothetical protein RIC35_14510 [Marinoscillum sp.]